MSNERGGSSSSTNKNVNKNHNEANAMNSTTVMTSQETHVVTTVRNAMGAMREKMERKFAKPKR